MGNKLGLSGKIYKLEEFKDRKEPFLEWNYEQILSFRWDYIRNKKGDGELYDEILGHNEDDFIEMCDLDNGGSISMGILTSDQEEGYKI